MLPPQTVVIVSANPGTQETYARQLRDAQVAALSVSSWRDVLTLAREMALAAVLVDVATAADWQSCRILRERQEMTGVPVVVLSDWAAPDRRCMERGVLRVCREALLTGYDSAGPRPRQEWRAGCRNRSSAFCSSVVLTRKCEADQTARPSRTRMA
jgi:hypothetical protein